MKNVALLGSTGSIGTSALKVIESHPDRYRLIALSAGRNLDLLLRQVEKFRPRAVAVLDREAAEGVRRRLPGGEVPRVFYGTEGICRIASHEAVDTVISAISGAAGLIPTYRAIEAGKDIALANKETLVMAGRLVMGLARDRGVHILPIDSEHSAVLQSLRGHPREDLKRIILTASGGPFRGLAPQETASVTPEQALNHPNWSMGPKITIDSATLMNKGLEAIEAKWLFGLEMEEIHMVIHPQSIIHSMVEYRDGSIIAQLGVPDMTTPISYALSFPNHLKSTVSPMDIETIGSLTFEPCDRKRFPCLDLALQAAEAGKSMPAVLNGANEAAVEAFLGRDIGFLQIPEVIERTMTAHTPFVLEDLEGVLEADRWARRTAEGVRKKIRP